LLPLKQKKKANCNDFFSSIQSGFIVHEKDRIRNSGVSPLGREKKLFPIEVGKVRYPG
jgi:hypothetical protein